MEATNSGGFASFIPLIILLFVCYYFFHLRSKNNKNQSPSKGTISSGWHLPRDPGGGSGLKLEKLLILVGGLGLFVSLGMDTTAPGTNVKNLGLMNDQQNYIIISGIILFIGVILYISNRKKISDKKAAQARVRNSKTCEFCAETIKLEAITCRYCGKDQEETW